MEEAERAERGARRFTIAAGIFEGTLLLAILLVIDFGEPTHLLIFLCACLVYGPIVLVLFALRSYVDMSMQRVLKAIHAGAKD